MQQGSGSFCVTSRDHIMITWASRYGTVVRLLDNFFSFYLFISKLNVYRSRVKFFKEPFVQFVLQGCWNNLLYDVSIEKHLENAFIYILKVHW